MGCGCGKRRKDLRASGQGTFVLRRPDGTESQHRTRLEAQAERVRAGGKGQIVRR